MRAIVLALALVCGGGSAFAQTAAMPDWLSGYWLSCENGEQTAENWIGAGSGMLLETNLVRSSRGLEFEMAHIAPSAGGLTYFAQPSGHPPVEFTLKEQGPRRVVFENLAHDFPQRVIYSRDGNVLHARIEGQINGHAEGQDWTMRRRTQDATCPRH